MRDLTELKEQLNCSAATTEQMFRAMRDALLAITALEARVAELEAMESRVRSALAYVDPESPLYSRDAIAADLRAGISLRKAAYKHGTTFAIVRGIARTALGMKE